MKSFTFLLLGMLLFNSCISSSGKNKDDQELIEKASTQLKNLTSILNSDTIRQETIFPRSLDNSGEIQLVGKKDWTSGFYPGILWLMYEMTEKSLWKTEATRYTNLLESEKLNSTSHDIGFKMMSSFGNAYRLTGNPKYREVLIQSARILITRFNQKVGCIRSWDHHADKWQFPVIIDNMMNLELLFWASKETGEPVFYNIAVNHATTTMKNHFKKDYSTYHVISYDSISGRTTAKNTHQGYSDESCWSRGEAWALYGYTMVYRETQNPEFLTQAENIAEYILNQPGIKEGKIPCWDFNAPDMINQPVDASAGAVICSALFELSNYSNQKEIYLKVANKLMTTLSSPAILATTGDNSGFLLKHSTGSKPADSEVDVPLIYADYYYLEAIKRKIEIDNSFKKL